MRTLTILFILILSSLINASDSTHFFNRGIYGSIGTSVGYIEADESMQHFFKPTSSSTNTIAPTVGLGLDFYLGKHFAASTGIAYLRTGQTTPETSVYFESSEYQHQFKAYALLNYLTVPLFLKGGLHTSRWSAFARAGLTPCYLVAKDVRWVIDGRTAEAGTLMPNVYVKRYDILCSIGLECGTHFGKNGFFITGDYNRGGTSIARGTDGSASNRVFCFGIKYSHMVIR